MTKKVEQEFCIPIPNWSAFGTSKYMAVNYPDLNFKFRGAGWYNHGTDWLLVTFVGAKEFGKLARTPSGKRRAKKSKPARIYRYHFFSHDPREQLRLAADLPLRS